MYTKHGGKDELCMSVQYLDARDAIKWVKQASFPFIATRTARYHANHGHILYLSDDHSLIFTELI